MEEENNLDLKELEQELHEIQKEMTFALYPITINKGQSHERNKNKSKTSA